MPGTAVLGDNLIDDLIETIDELRAELPPDLGQRQYRVYTVLRTWQGDEVGAGVFAEVETELTPPPIVESLRGQDRLEPAGLDEADVIRLSEVSLSYTEAELAGAALERNQQWLIRLRDRHGQETRARDFVLAGSPWPDRLKTIGWIVNLRRASDAEVV